MLVRRALGVAVLAAALGAGATAAPAPGPAQRVAAVERLVRAVATSNESAMWGALSTTSRRRLGPTLAEFRARGARGVRASLAPFVRRSRRVIVNDLVGRDLGVVALLQPRTHAAFAAPVRRERGAWRVEIDPVFTVEAVRPLTDDDVRKRTQVFAEVAAPARIDSGGMWFDGLPFYSRAYWSPDGRHMSMWDEAPQPLARGLHTVVAYASAGREAAANAWVFTVR
ncbi:MAG TPA: hypothetical protein VFR32_10560 [Gaiellaceae bacterium]|nr:hypothetical protein [Gaiellaceae bacterium]